MRRTKRVLLAAPLAAALLAAACGGADGPSEGQLLLSWTFADGRSCSEAGAPSVYVGPPGGDHTRFDCASGLGRSVEAGKFQVGALEVEAVSADGAPLYRARTEMPPADPAVVSVVLVFVGGLSGP